MSSAVLRSAYAKIDQSDKKEAARKQATSRAKKRRLWNLRNTYKDENDATLLPRRAISSAQQTAKGWMLVRTVTILKPYDQELDILWLPERDGAPEQVVARYAFHR